MMGVKSENKHTRPSKMVCLFLFLIGAAVTFAQLPTATILGVVKDSSGAVVPGASLTAKNLETGQTRTTVSGADGSYRFAALPVGSYELRVEHPGFHSVVQSALTLTVGQEAVMNFRLQVGTIEQTVSVAAEAPLVNTTSGSLGGLVSEQKVSDLPLNGRNFVDLTLLQPGIVENKNMTHAGSFVGTWYSSNGAPFRSNNYLLDGAIMQDALGASPASIANTSLGIEGIREWRVVTNSFSAEYGLSMGSQTTIVTKSGANNFHGSAFEFLRNNVLDARNFFDRKTPLTPNRLPPFKRNNFGGSFGGPVKKNKVFFFATYEGLRERLGTTTVSNTIPASAKADGALVPQIDPRIKPLLALFPEPNLPNSQFTFPFSQPANEDFGQGRVDQTLSDKDTWFGRITVDETRQVQPLEFPMFKTTRFSQNQYATVAENHIFSPALLNTFRFSFSHTELRLDSPSDIGGPGLSFVPGQPIGNILIGGVQTFGPRQSSPLVQLQNIFSWSDDLFYTRGAHSLKFGTLINHYQWFFETGTLSRGLVQFANTASFLQATPTNFQGKTPGSILDNSYHFNTLGFYAQDDWRVKPGFTLNLGLRYEFQTVPEEVTGYGAALRDLRFDAMTTRGKPFRNPSLSAVSPRLGFAWDVRGDGKTAVRGGAAILYDVGTFGSALASGSGTVPPFASSSTVAGPAAAQLFSIPFFFPPQAAGKSIGGTVDYNLAQPYVAQYNLSVERQLPWNVAATVTYAGSRGINLMQVKEGNPTIPQVLPGGRKFFPVDAPRTNPNFNDIRLATAAGNSWYSALQFVVNKRLSNGLQFQSSYTYSRTIDETQGQSTPDSVSSTVNGTDPSDRKVDRGLAAFDVTHNWRLNGIYHLPAFKPSGGVLDKLSNGWWASGILSVLNGFPFTPALQANRSRSGVLGGVRGTDRPDLVPGRHSSNIILGGPDRFFDPRAFTVPEAGFFGTAGRNILRGPAFATLDFTIAKDTALKYLGESGKLEFRAEFFNILNRVNLSTPAVGVLGGDISGLVFAGNSVGEAPLPTAGRITSTASTSRQIQFALKLLF